MTVAWAVLFSLLAPGAGHLYLGQREKAGVYGAVGLLVPSIITPLMGRLFIRSGSMSPLFLVSMMYSAVVLVCLVDTAGAGIERQAGASGPPTSWEKGWGFVVVFQVVTQALTLAGVPRLLLGV